MNSYNYFYYSYNFINKIDLIEKLNYKNIHQIIKLNKINLKISKKQQHISEPFALLEYITGQKPILISAKKSISSFLIRKQVYSSVGITIRKHNLNNFLILFILIVFPNLKKNNFYTEKQLSKLGSFNISLDNILSYPFLVDEYNNKFKNNYGIDISINFNNNSYNKFNQTILLLSSYHLINK